jgi:hypothetical protein
VLNGIKAQAEMLGYDITFINTSPVGKKLSYLEHCKYRNFDGVVIVCARFQDNEVQELMSSDIPVVTIDYVHYSCSAVSFNNVKCMGELLDYIISMGHKKIAYIHGQDFSSVTRDRLAAYYRALEKHGIDIPEEYVREARYLETEDVANQTEYLLDLPDKPTCIIYPDDTAKYSCVSPIAASSKYSTPMLFDSFVLRTLAAALGRYPISLAIFFILFLVSAPISFWSCNALLTVAVETPHLCAMSFSDTISFPHFELVS